MFKIINLERFIKHKTTREWIEALIFALIVAFIFRTWIYAPYRVPTGSMHPTILVGDHLFADKHAYGFVIPFTDVKLFPKPVQRGDIVIFPSPEDPSVDFIKRAVAVAGNEVEIVGEILYIDGKPEPGSYVFYDDRMPPVNGTHHPDFPNKPFIVPEGKVLTLGDNRRNSKDSRYWGFLEEKTVQGKGIIFYWSHDPNRSLFDLDSYRLERIGKLLK